MPLIKCSECLREVSDSAFVCPSCGFQLKKPKRGFFGQLFKWSFILFNVFMVAWLFSYFGSVGELMNEPMSEAGQAGAAIGTALGTGMILSIWVMGDVILGLFVLFTKPRVKA